MNFILLSLVVTVCHETQAAYFQGFDNVGSVTNNNDPLKWAWLNKSQNAGSAATDPSVGGWWQGALGQGTFFAQSGPADSYARADYSSAPFGNVYSNWFITPTFDFTSGDTFSFYTRTITNSGHPDRLQIWLSTSGTNINVGPDYNSVGNFSTLMGDINPNLNFGGYPDTWTQFTYSLNSSFTGRIGFRYYVTDTTSRNGNYIGVDSFSTTANLYSPVPEPSTYLLGLAAAGILSMAKRRIRTQLSSVKSCNLR